MPTTRLTKRVVDALASAERAIVYYDEDLAGFGVRVMPSGFKSWVVEYRPHGGGRRVATTRMSLGPTTTLTPDEARRAARDILASVRLGEDPARKRLRSRETPTVAKLMEDFIAEEVRPKRKASTANLYELYIRTVIKPELGSIKADVLTKADVARLHRKVGVTRPPTANRVLALLSAAYSYGAANKIVGHGFNPAKGVLKFQEKSRERFLSTDELQRLGAVLHEAETIGLLWDSDGGKPTSKHLAREDKRRTVVSPFAVAALRLLLLTGCRLREILHLRWSELDFERGMLFLPDSKTGKKPVILNAPALAVLDSLPRQGVFVIAGDNPNKPRSDLKRPWQSIARQAGLKGLRIHDLRHSFASVGAGCGMGLPIVGKLLGHTQVKTTARYAHLDADPLRRASEQIGSRIAAALSSASCGEVASLRNEAKQS